jgi:hypothetical protein
MEDKYTRAQKERQKYIDAVLSSSSKKKIVVAGPGTGKTFLFKKVLQGKSKTLTLTFVNSLVEDLSLELNGISDVKRPLIIISVKSVKGNLSSLACN